MSKKAGRMLEGRTWDEMPGMKMDKKYDIGSSAQLWLCGKISVHEIITKLLKAPDVRFS